MPAPVAVSQSRARQASLCSSSPCGARNTQALMSVDQPTLLSSSDRAEESGCSRSRVSLVRMAW
jgi:hypothetical protein